MSRALVLLRIKLAANVTCFSNLLLGLDICGPGERNLFLEIDGKT